MSGNESLDEQLKVISDQVDQIVVEGRRPTSSSSQETSNTTSAEESSSQTVIDPKTLSDIQLIQYLTQKGYEKQVERYERSQRKGKDVPKEHKFWNTQPMLPLTEEVTDRSVNGPINDTVKVEDVRKEPYTMPAGFEWCDLDISDPAQAQELYTLLTMNYVEDDDCMFRFDYSVDFLQWALTPPHFRRDWHVGVRNTKTKALMGCITAIPVNMRVYDQVRPMAEINFLCVHKKLRTKRLAPVLIKEITRRVNLTDVWQAAYTAGIVLPKPVARCRYFHRSLNPKKLVEIRFSMLPPRTTLADLVKSLKLPKKPSKGLREMTEEDVAGVTVLLNQHLSSSTQLAQVFTEDEVRHVFLPRKGVVNSYVIHGDKVTDFCSLYHLPSSVIGNPLHDKLNAVYSYYNVATTITFEELMTDLLVFARNEGADVFNALDLMQNNSVFDKLKFGAGDGWLQYYVYNWKCATMNPEEVGLVLL